MRIDMSEKPNITAIIYNKRGHVLSIGKNSYLKTHPLQAKHAIIVEQPNRIYLHAEIDAIIKCRDLDRAFKIVITRLNKKGAAMLAKPCAICQSAISQTPLQVVEHS